MDGKYLLNCPEFVKWSRNVGDSMFVGRFSTIIGVKCLSSKTLTFGSGGLGF